MAGVYVLMPSTFNGRLDMLLDYIGGPGTLTMRVEFDQVYAHRQHEEIGWKHPRGGQAQYLSAPFYEMYIGFMENLAAHALEDEGLKRAMIENAQALGLKASLLAPMEWGVLKGSAHPTVEEDGVVVYDSPPIFPRLDDATLDQMHRMWADMFPNPWPRKTNRRRYKGKGLKWAPWVTKGLGRA
jgi:hypothetical protein